MSNKASNKTNSKQTNKQSYNMEAANDMSTKNYSKSSNSTKNCK
ncbi:hypothetical protein [Sporanaerobium hydrogeniformans]|nr:hypothetical protein [Sporanaerobium hydrogeniformans]